MNFKCSSSVLSVCMKNWLFIIVVFIVIQSMWAQPTTPLASTTRKSCGRDLVDRVDRICQNRGGHMTSTKARRIRRGIVNECCMNKCADYHIYAYCSNDKPEIVSESFLETPEMTMDLEVAESRAMPSPSQHFMDTQNTIVQNVGAVTRPSVERFTLGPDHPYQDIYVKSNVDSEFVNRLIKTLPHNSNDFQVGTVPPEYRMSRYIPSRIRIATNY